ncbi:hypothetical protein NDU88_005167, partial [Pleurodeles waltl]
VISSIFCVQLPEYSSKLFMDFYQKKAASQNKMVNYDHFTTSVCVFASHRCSNIRGSF